MDKVTGILRIRFKANSEKNIIIISTIIFVAFLVVIFNSHDLFTKEATANLKTKYEIEHLYNAEQNIAFRCEVFP